MQTKEVPIKDGERKGGGETRVKQDAAQLDHEHQILGGLEVLHALLNRHSLPQNSAYIELISVNDEAPINTVG